MSEKENSENDEAKEGKLSRAAERTRAYRLRKRDKETWSAEEKVWMAEYEESRMPPGRKPPQAEPEATEAPVIETPEFEAEASAPPPPPPRVSTIRADSDERETGRATADGDWRKKYKTKSVDREGTVLFFAGQWMSFLQWAAGQIRFAGGTPMIDPKDIFGAVVLTVDDILPSKVVAKPIHAAAVGSTLILGQRVLMQKRIVAAYEAAERDGVTPPAPEPPPPPPPEPAPAPGPDAPIPVPETPPAPVYNDTPPQTLPIIQIPADAMTDPGLPDVY